MLVVAVVVTVDIRVPAVVITRALINTDSILLNTDFYSN